LAKLVNGGVVGDNLTQQLNTELKIQDPGPKNFIIDVMTIGSSLVGDYYG